jgi:putative DNA primase/helicase
MAYQDDRREDERLNDARRMLAAPSEPMAVARELLAAKYRAGETLRHWRGGWVEWSGTRWVEAEERHVRGSVYAFTEHATYLDGDRTKAWAPNRYKVADVLDAASSIVHLAENTAQPSWLKPTVLPPAREYVSCANGLLHVPTRSMVGHTPEMFNTTSVPFAYDAAASLPERWLAFLAELWPDDPDAVAALQEFIGYVLSGRTDLHKVLLMVGPTRAGKGVIARVLKALVGDGNHCGPTLASLATNFGLAPLIGKPLAIVSDARLGGRDVNQVVERLLSISGEDMLTIDRKYREHWTGTLPTRFLIASNELPRFGDASGAIANRFILLTLNKSFLGNEDPSLTRTLLGELPGIFNWALDGLERLERQGHFTRVESSFTALLALQDAVSPASAFVRDNCEVGPYTVACSDLYDAWKSWCEDNGHKPGPSSSFGIHLRAVNPGIQRSRPRDDGVRVPTYTGIKLRPARPYNGTDLGTTGDSTGSEHMDRAVPRSNPMSAHVSGMTRRHHPRLEALADELDAGVATLAERLAALDTTAPDYGDHVADLRAADAIARKRKEPAGG